MEITTITKPQKQKIFISYGDKRFSRSLHWIINEAKHLHFFDKVIAYTDKDLPLPIKSNPLFTYTRGGGYWCWKPYIIWKTMQDYPNAIVVYADAGCILNKGTNWDIWFNYLEKYDTLLFRYRQGTDYGWKKGGHKSDNVELLYWAKQSTQDFFSPWFVDDSWKHSALLLGGLIFSTNNSPIIKSWMDIMLFHPELVIDPIYQEIHSQPEYADEHRHDQAILTILSQYHINKGDAILILDETAESQTTHEVIAARRKPNKRMTTKTRIIHLIRFIGGDSIYERIHEKLFKK